MKLLNDVYNINYLDLIPDAISLEDSLMGKFYVKTINGKIELDKLQHHVKQYIKPLIDYLETNYTRLPECADVLLKRINNCEGEAASIITLLCCKELLI
jgi:hypothetical protein